MAWNLGSKKHPDGKRDLTVYLDSDDATGLLRGWLRYLDKSYIAEGRWAAAGSTPGRKRSIMSLLANNQADAPAFLAMAGRMKDGQGQPAEIEINLVRVSSTDGKETGWGGVLTPLGAAEIPAKPG